MTNKVLSGTLSLYSLIYLLQNLKSLLVVCMQEAHMSCWYPAHRTLARSEPTVRGLRMVCCRRSRDSLWSRPQAPAQGN